MEELWVTDSVTVKEIEKQIKVLKTAHDKVKNSAQKEIIQKKIDKYTFSKNKLISLFKNDLISKKIDIEKIRKNKRLYELYNKVVADNFKELSLANINELSSKSRGWGELEKPKDNFQNFVDFIEGKNDWFSIATVGKASVVTAALGGIAIFASGAFIPALIAAAAISPAVFKKEFKGLWNLAKDTHKANNAMKDSELEVDANQDIKDYSQQVNRQNEATTKIRDIAHKHYTSDDDRKAAADAFRAEFNDLDKDIVEKLLSNYGLAEGTPSPTTAFQELENDASFKAGVDEHKSFKDFYEEYERVLIYLDANHSQADKQNELAKLIADSNDPSKFAGDPAKADKVQRVCKGMAKICEAYFDAMAEKGSNLDNTEKEKILKQAKLDELHNLNFKGVAEKS